MSWSPCGVVINETGEAHSRPSSPHPVLLIEASPLFPPLAAGALRAQPRSRNPAINGYTATAPPPWPDCHVVALRARRVAWRVAGGARAATRLLVAGVAPAALLCWLSKPVRHHHSEVCLR
jgi:hypothetical protein